MTYGMKTGAEMLTNNQINALSAMIRNGGQMPANALADMERMAAALMAARSAQSATGR